MIKIVGLGPRLPGARRGPIPRLPEAEGRLRGPTPHHRRAEPRPPATLIRAAPPETFLQLQVKIS